MTHVDSLPGFGAGGAFYENGPWGHQAVFDVFGDELDGQGSSGYFDCLPSNITSNDQLDAGGGLSAAAFEGAIDASKADDPSRPTYIQVTTSVIDGDKNYHYSLAQKQAICTDADIFSFDVYPVVLRGDPDYSTYDNVQEARKYCEGKVPVMPIIEQDQMNGNGVFPTPAQTTAEVWDAIIAGARGVQYFDQYWSIGSGRPMDAAVTATDAEVESLAPVLNSDTADGFVTASGNVNLLAKYYDGNFYVLAIPHAGGSQSVTFTVAAGSSVTVLNEDRSIPVVNGTFSDSFANQDTVHIYQVNG